MGDHRGSSRREHEQLAKYWDAIAAGHPPDLTALDPELAAAIGAFHRLAARDNAQRPDPRFVHRLLEELMATATTISPGFISQNILPAQSPNGRAWPAQGLASLPPRRVSWSGGALITSVLVLLTLIGGLFAIGSHRLGREEGAPVVMPAVVGTPEASPVPILRLNVTGLSCPGPCAQLIRTRIAPDGFIQESSTNPDSELFYVESGTITTRLLEGERPAVNLGSGLEAAPPAATPTADGETTIAAGQAGWITPGTTIEVRNDGTTPASVIWLIEGAETVGTQGLDWEFLSSNAPGDIPGSPLLITLDRRTLAPNAELTYAPAPTITAAGAVDSRSGFLASTKDGYRNARKFPLDVYVLTIEPQAAPATSPAGAVETATP